MLSSLQARSDGRPQPPAPQGGKGRAPTRRDKTQREGTDQTRCRRGKTAREERHGRRPAPGKLATIPQRTAHRAAFRPPPLSPAALPLSPAPAPSPLRPRRPLRFDDAPPTAATRHIRAGGGKGVAPRLSLRDYVHQRKTESKFFDVGRNFSFDFYDFAFWILSTEKVWRNWACGCRVFRRG